MTHPKHPLLEPRPGYVGHRWLLGAASSQTTGAPIIPQILYTRRHHGKDLAAANQCARRLQRAELVGVDWGYVVLDEGHKIRWVQVGEAGVCMSGS